MTNVDVWYVDFGASIHFFHRRDCFYEYEKTSPIEIYMGNNSTQNIVSKGKIMMKLTMRENTIFAMLNDVIYVPSLTKNFFFVSEATSQGYSVEFDDDNCEVRKN
jgi:hypothetical protein